MKPPASRRPSPEDDDLLDDFDDFGLSPRNRCRRAEAPRKDPRDRDRRWEDLPKEATE